MLDLAVIAESVSATTEPLVYLAIVLVTGFLLPFLKSKLSVEKLEEIQNWIRTAVAAAEQIYTGDGRGAEKKAYVMSFLQNKNLTNDMPGVDNLIEAEVYKLSQEKASTAETTEETKK
jgi:hypothetical protein